MLERPDHSGTILYLVQTEFGEILEYAKTLKIEVIMADDFNIDLLGISEKNMDTYLDTVLGFEFQNHIAK